MVRRPLRLATTEQLERSAQAAGFDVYRLPDLPTRDFHRPLNARLSDGPIIAYFLEEHDIELMLDYNTEMLTLLGPENGSTTHRLTNVAAGVPYVSLYLDPITSTMGQVAWADHWALLENSGWIKGVFENAHAQELVRLGVSQVTKVPMAAAVDDFDTSPMPDPDPGPVVAFMGHPATSWFRSPGGVLPAQLYAGFTAAAVHADMPEVPFHTMYYDLYGFAEPPLPSDSPQDRARKSQEYYANKFAYNAFLAIKQRDRFAHFLKRKLGNRFELIGDHWGENYGLPHTPRIWDKKKLHGRMRRVPICLNLMKGNIETGLIVRHFEVTAYGGFLLTYPTPELADFFEIGEECDVFRSEEELLQKISFYLHHPKRRREIALAGQRRTLGEHLYSHRITTLVETLRSSGTLCGQDHPPQSGKTLPRIVVDGVPDSAAPACSNVLAGK